MKEVDYESTKILSEYLHFHYARAEEINPRGNLPQEFYDYPRRIVEERFATGQDPSRKIRGLDIGCAVGASCFAMAKYCGEVIGVDYSNAFISTAQRLQEEGALEYEFYVEGQRSEKFTATVDPTVDKSRVTFLTGDAHDLPAEMGRFDWVLAANLLCRLHSPVLFLERLPSLLVSGGTLVINSPFTWMTEHTPIENWIGGTNSGLDSAAKLKELLSPNFEFVDEQEMPFLIRETGRKYQLTFAHSAKWIRR